VTARKTLRPGLRAAALTVLLAAGCARVEPPVIAFRGVRYEGGDSVQVELGLANPNRFAVELASVEYRLMADGETLGAGQRTERVRCAARDSVRAEFPLALDFGATMAAVLKGVKDTVTFGVEGEYRLKTPVGPYNGRFAEARGVNLLDELKAVLENAFGRGE
jgi:hypothetical protein